MNYYQDNMENLLKQFNELISKNFNENQMQNISSSLLQLSNSMKKAVEGVSFQFLTDEMKFFIAEVQESEKLSQKEFEIKYSYEMEVCKKLGRAGWVISEHSNPREVSEWYELLMKQEDKKIISYFEGNNGYILSNIFFSLENKYEVEPYKRYFLKAKNYFEQKDYMTTAMYLVGLIESRTNDLMKYPKGIRYKQKYSVDGFENHLQKEFKKLNSFITKRFLFLNMYPSIVEYLNRLFVDGEYTFENGNEPLYINRNWLLHGKSCREIERYECIQLFNVLSVIEFVFSCNKEIDR